jgi:hypothetical protein
VDYDYGVFHAGWRTRKETIVQTEENGLNITNVCYQCHSLNELCPDCQEERDVRDITAAHQLVDEGSDYIVFGYGANSRTVANAGTVGEHNPLSIIRDLPSGHDWTERDEFLEPVSLLVDRLYDLETSLLITPGESICESCHLVFNRYAPCPNCK